MSVAALRGLSGVSLLLLGASLASCGGGELDVPASAGAAGVGGSAGAATKDECKPALVEIPEPVAHTPRWAFEPWISKDISDTDDTYAFVSGFRSRGIAVGVVVLDSPWETSYNTLQPNPVRYHDFDKLVADMKQDGVRVVLWLTPQVNSRSLDFEAGGDLYKGAAENFDVGQRCGFFIDDGEEVNWWKGKGASVDFFDPYAAAWWHGLQNRVLDAGVSGFKLDFGESYIRESTVKTHAGVVPHQAYSEAYYRDFLAYGQLRRGKEDFVTMVRPWDESYDFAGRFFARREHAPVAWVGDNRRDFVGMKDALREMFISAAAGYVVLGSDVGGYLDLDDKTLKPVAASTEVFLRWTALGGLVPFMQLHGRANLTPWTVPDHQDESVATWRYWATLHHELVPFFYSLAEEGHASHVSIMRPVGDAASWEDDFRFHLGDAMLVAPILELGGKRDIVLPTGARYWDFWKPEAGPIAGGTTLPGYTLADWGKQPVFFREGAIVPMSITGDATGIGAAAFAGQATVLVYPGPGKSSFTVHDEDGKTTLIEASDAAGGTVSLSRTVTPTLLRVRVDAGVSGATLDGVPLALATSLGALAGASSGLFVDAATHAAWVKVPKGDAARTVVLTK